MTKNSSKVVAAQAPRGSTESYSSTTVTVEPIDNGYLKTVSECRDGEYHATKTFSVERPELDVAPAAERRETSNSLKEAIAAVKGK